MYIALLVGLCLLTALGLGASALVYSSYIYYRNRVFSKTKVSVLWIVVCGFMVIFMTIGIVCFSLDANTWHTCLEFDPAYIALSSVCLFLSIAYLVFFSLLPKLTNKNKIPYDQMMKVDYQTKIKQIQQRLGDLNKVKNDLLTHHKHYYQDMLFYYEKILNRLKDQKISLVEKMADIVTFNDTFTHYWCTKTNDYQLLLTYQFCEALKKFF